MVRVIFVTPHGLGDAVMLTPALRKYKEEHPDSYIAVAGQKRFGDTFKKLLSGLPYIDEVVTILPDPWEDGVQHYNRKLYEEVLKVADDYGKENQFHQGILLPTNKQGGHRLHKIFRFESEVGVSFTSMEDLQTEVNVLDEYIIKAEAFLSKYEKPIVLLHNDAGNPPKEFTDEELQNMLGNFKEYTILEFGKDISYDDMEFTKAVIKCADLVIAIDSVVMHIAGALKKPLVALFKSTPVHQAIPITYSINCYGYDNEITQLSKVPEYRYKIAETYGLPEFKVDEDVIIQQGLGESDGSGFNYDKYRQIQLDAEKWDGEPRLTLETYGEDAVKFFNEVKKHLPDETELPKFTVKSRILDIGGCTGVHSKMLSEKYNRKVIMIDINPELVKLAKKNCKEYNVECKNMDLDEMSFRNKSFDMIFCKDSLEHSYKPNETILKMYDMLVDCGIAVVYLPLDGEQRGIETLDLSMSDGYQPHVFKTTEKDIVKRFEEVGFTVKYYTIDISNITGRKRSFGNRAITIVANRICSRTT